MRVRWSVPAKCDLVAILDYLDAEAPSVADIAEARIMEAVTSLTKFPNLGRPGRTAGTRELVISGHPYILVYRIQHEQAWVLRVMHMARSFPEAR